MDPEEDFNRFRLRTRVQAVAVIDILVGTVPFINLAFDFNNKEFAEQYPDRENLVFFWSVLLCVYVLQLVMGIWLLAATREVYSEYTVGNCQVWFYVAMFSLVFYMGEMAFDISKIVDPANNTSIKQAFITMFCHGAKIIYRAFALMTVNNFLFEICKPVQRYLSRDSYQFKYYYHNRLGIPLPDRRASVAVPSVIPVQTNDPTYSYFSTYPQPRHKGLPTSSMMGNNISHPRPHHSHHPSQTLPPPRPPRLLRPQPQPPYHHHHQPRQQHHLLQPPPPIINSRMNYLHQDGMAVRAQ